MTVAHAVLEQFAAGLRDAGHSCEVVDLYAINFDTVFRRRDLATYLHEDIPPPRSLGAWR